MKYDTLRAAIEGSPFKPFSIHTGGGRDYPVVHPENILASPKFETLFLKYGDDRTAIIDIDSIVELVYPATATPETARKQVEG